MLCFRAERAANPVPRKRSRNLPKRSGPIRRGDVAGLPRELWVLYCGCMGKRLRTLLAVHCGVLVFRPVLCAPTYQSHVVPAERTQPTVALKPCCLSGVSTAPCFGTPFDRSANRNGSRLLGLTQAQSPAQTLSVHASDQGSRHDAPRSSAVSVITASHVCRAVQAYDLSPWFFVTSAPGATS